MTLVLAAAAGFLAARLLWVLLRPTFRQPGLLRENYRGEPVPTAAGVVLPLALLVVEGGRVVAGSAGVGSAGGLSDGRASVAAAAAGLGIRVVAVAEPAYGGELVEGIEAALDALGELGEGDAVLVKGSRVAGLERLAERLARR